LGVVEDHERQQRPRRPSTASSAGAPTATRRNVSSGSRKRATSLSRPDDLAFLVRAGRIARIALDVAVVAGLVLRDRRSQRPRLVDLATSLGVSSGGVLSSAYQGKT
jgi:hypothetical protein